jgi:hypothetical protein
MSPGGTAGFQYPAENVRLGTLIALSCNSLRCLSQDPQALFSLGRAFLAAQFKRFPI